MEIVNEIRKMKEAAPYMAASLNEERIKALEEIKKALEKNASAIFDENKKDLEAAAKENIPDAVMKRLKFDEGKLKDCLAGIDQLISLDDPVGRVTMRRELDENLVLTRINVPIGVIGVIFEARPDALVQISSLCVRSGNCAVLKGGKETTFTNRILFKLISDAASKAGLPGNILIQAEQHAEIDELLKLDGLVDLLIPRGSNAFVQYIMDHTKIPVMGHADGICHIYVDKAADTDMAIPVIIDAKTQYTAACNAVETLLINRDIAESFIPQLSGALKGEGVRVRGSKEALSYLPEGTEEITHDGFVEYLDMIVSVGIVGDVKEAAEHINRFGSHHTDCILTTDDAAWETFRQLTDSAGVYRNCSTRFADGFRYGFGAEVGIGTGKLHARGPVGLDGLMTYKYLLEGKGQIVGDYASGKSSFHFRDL